MNAGEKRRYNRIRMAKKKDVREVDTNEENGRKFTLERFLSDVETHSLPVSEDKEKTNCSPKKIRNKPVKLNQQTTRGLFENAMLGRTTLKERPLSPNNLARFQEDVVALANEESSFDFFNDFEVNGDMEKPTAAPSSIPKPSSFAEDLPQEILELRNPSPERNNLNVSEVQEPNTVFDKKEVGMPTSGVSEDVPNDRDETYRLAKNLMEMLRKWNEEKQKEVREVGIQSLSKVENNDTLFHHNQRNPSRVGPEKEFSFNDLLLDTSAPPNRRSDEGLSFFSPISPQRDTFFGMPFAENFNKKSKIRMKDDRKRVNTTSFPPFQPSVNPSRLFREKRSGTFRASPRYGYSGYALRNEHPHENEDFLQTRDYDYFVLPKRTSLSEQRARDRVDQNLGRFSENDYRSHSLSRNQQMQERAILLRDRGRQHDPTTMGPPMPHFMTRMAHNRCFDRTLSPRKY